MKHRSLLKLLSLTLIITLLASIVPFSALAAETDKKENISASANEDGKVFAQAGAEEKVGSVYTDYPNLETISKERIDMDIFSYTQTPNGICDAMTPQGICVMDDYIMVSAYCAIDDYKSDLNDHLNLGDNAEKLENEADHKEHNPVIYVFSRSGKNLLLTMSLPSKSHVGGIAYDGNYVWVTKSSDTLSKNRLMAISKEYILNALANHSGEMVEVSYAAESYCSCRASFVCYYDNRLWVGEFFRDKEGELKGFKVNDDLSLSPSGGSLTIPKKANGAAFAGVGGEVCLAVNCSEGRDNDSTTHLYTVDMSGANPVIVNEHNSFKLPPMAEEICVNNGKVYTLFESGSTAYSNVTGHKCEHVVTDICISNLRDWFYWTDGFPNNDYNGYAPTYEESASCVPNYVLNYNNDKAITLFNPYTAKMLMNMSIWAYDVDNSDTSWQARTSQNYGYTQYKKIINSASYDLGEYDEEYEYTDDEGETQVEQITKQKIFSGLNAGIALKEVNYNGKTKYAIVVAFRGTDDFEDFLNDINFPANEDGIHTGFAKCARDFYEETKSQYFTIGDRAYSLYYMIQEMKKEDSDFCMLVTGHSLGAAIADVFVGHYLYKDGIDSRNVAAYTFATPRSIDNSRSLSNIFNIINNDDIIPKLGGSYHIGTDLEYYPDDAFRMNYNGNVQALAAHSKDYSYLPLTNYLCSMEDGQYVIDSYTHNHTCGDVSFGKIIINRDCFSGFSGNFNANLLGMHDCRLEIGGDATITRLYMNHDSDYLLVNGNFEVGGGDYGEGDLSAGTVELKGDFYVHSNNSAYREQESHSTILSGDKLQSVYFESTSTSDNIVKNLYINNPNVRFTSDIGYLKLNQDLHITGIDAIYIKQLELNGYTLTVDCDLTVDGIITSGGNLYAKKNYTDSGIFYNYDCSYYYNSKVTIGGDFALYKAFIENCRFNIGGNADIYELVMANDQIEIYGNAVIARLYMNHDNDYLLVNGNFEVGGGSYGEGNLSAGTVELKGDFYVHSNNSAYKEQESHSTILSGDKLQSVYFESTSTSDNIVKNLYINNPNVRFTSDIGYLKLNQDLHITGIDGIYIKQLELNGYTLTVDCDLTVDGINTSGGNLYAKKNFVDHEYSYYYHNNQFSNSTVTVGGDFISKYVFAEDSHFTIGGNATITRLYMNHDSDYLLVNGNFEVGGGSYGEGNLSAGTVELKGDFYVHSNNSAYKEQESHSTILSGDKLQSVYFESTSYSDNYFNNLILLNSSKDGVKFNSGIRINNLFNHNRTRFTLYNDGLNSTFVDYDNDGLLDNVDQLPLDPNRGLIGDVNADGIVSVSDTTMIQRNLIDMLSFDDSDSLCADVNNNGIVDIDDATLIQRYAAEYINDLYYPQYIL